ncbi:Phosphatidyl-myo-inositol mannosyltransferase [bacterium HR41]|nr:Phosphatidyl-myo-inositol mannosyltransferase [bacterium HR41]
MLHAVGDERFRIAQVTPYPWEHDHEVNRWVDRVASELARRGHAVVVVAPSDSPDLVRRGRERVAALADGTEEPAWGERAVLCVGHSVPFRRGGSLALPIDVSRTIERLFERTAFDFVHVHEPFAPSASSAALRHARSLSVASFHAATERFLSTQLARPLVRLLFKRLDGRTASYRATRDLLARFFPGDYELVTPGAARFEAASGDLVRGLVEDASGCLIGYVADEEPAALRLFLRALRRLPDDVPWRAVVLARGGAAPAQPLSRRLRERVRFVGTGELDEGRLLAAADVLVAASSGVAARPGTVLAALAARCVPVVSRVPLYEECVSDGERGLLFQPRDAATLASQLERVVRSPSLRDNLVRAAEPLRAHLDWARVASEVEALYRRIAAHRKPAAADPALRRRLARKPLIDVDLHMHTDHSPDCATPVEALLERAERVGLGAIAVTDHNEISGALEARAKADGRVQVIVGEEIKTAEQGEVIGLFIERKIPRGLSLAETIAEIRAQGGIVYVPHPFDRMHAVPDYEHLLSVIDEIDAIEVFNPRVAFSAFNEEAARFAAKYRIPAGAGSDAHVLQGLGSVRVRMRAFDGPEEFLASLRDAEIIRGRRSLVYVQALKFLQTRAGVAPRAQPRQRKRKRDASKT